MMIFNVDPLKDSNRYNSKVHYRLYKPIGKPPTVICVQGFDYSDYHPEGFLTYDAYADEDEAEAALDRLRTAIIRLAHDFEQE